MEPALAPAVEAVALPDGAHAALKFELPRIPAEPHFSNLLGSRSISVTNTPVEARWRLLLSERAHLTLFGACEDEAGICDDRRLVAMRKEIERLRGMPLAEQVAAVNTFVNRNFRYAADQQTYGVGDRWASLREFIALAQGDCEDFAIAKFWMLVAAGVEPETMRLVVLRDTVMRADHAVLAVQTAGEVLILDNRSHQVRVDRALRHYQPIYSLAGSGAAWLHMQPAQTLAANAH